MKLLVLYASHGDSEQPCVSTRFVLDRLSRLELDLRHVTTNRPLSSATRAWHQDRGIGLLTFPNEGWDFGLWLKTLDQVPWQEYDRLCLMNDSVIYYADVLSRVLAEAEAFPASAIGLTSNTDFAYHLQSFFLYLKAPAIAPAVAHMRAIGVGRSFGEVIIKQEVGLSRNLIKLGLGLGAIYDCNKFADPILYSYPQLIQSGAGFIKRKLLLHAFSEAEMGHIVSSGYGEVVAMDYLSLIASSGSLDPSLSLAELVQAR